MEVVLVLVIAISMTTLVMIIGTMFEHNRGLSESLYHAQVREAMRMGEDAYIRAFQDQQIRSLTEGDDDGEEED